jgi:hypothetical protein
MMMLMRVGWVSLADGEGLVGDLFLGWIDWRREEG